MTAYVIADDCVQQDLYISVYVISAHVLSLALRLNYSTSYVKAILHSTTSSQELRKRSGGNIPSLPSALEGATSFLERGSYEYDQIRVSLCLLCLVYSFIEL